MAGLEISAAPLANPGDFDAVRTGLCESGVTVWRFELNRGSRRNAGRIEETVAYMKQHLTEPLRISTLAAVARMSEPHYFASFKRLTGFTPLHFFIRLRMQSACQLLVGTALSVKEVAAHLGYDDPFYFSRIFKSVLAVSPTEYRVGEMAKSRARQ